MKRPRANEYSLEENIKWFMGYIYGNITGILYNLIEFNYTMFWVGCSSFVKGFETGLAPYL